MQAANQKPKPNMTTNTTDTTTHSPTPWRRDSSIGIIYDPSGNMALQYLEEPEHPITEANATHIVHCVNLHDELVAELKACDSAFACWQLGQIPGRPEDILALIGSVRKALARAEGREG